MNSSAAEWRTYVSLVGEARTLCASCPLWAECLRDAVVFADPYGYAAATTPADRRWMRRRLGVGEPDGSLNVTPSDRLSPNEVVRQRRRFPEPSQREMAAELGCSRSTVARRLASERAKAAGGAHGEKSSRPEPDMNAILDAFDALQEQLARDGGMTVGIGGALGARQPKPQNCGRPVRPLRPSLGQPAPAPAGPGVPRAEEPAETISVSLSDPALAVKKAVLWPLLGAAEPPLERAEKLVVMLAAAPGSTVTPEDLERLATARRTLRSMLPANVARPVELDIRGTVSVDSAMTDPVGALHRALLRPLLDTLVGVLKNIETVMGMLMAVPVPGITTADVEAIRGARSVLEAQLSLAGADPARATGTAAAAPDDHPEPAPGTGARTSIRLAVEEALTSVVEPFAVKDVLRVLVERLGYSPLLYRDLGKSVSNVLSNMVRAGTLTRVSRGTYVRPRNPAAGTIPRQGVPTHE